MLKRAGINQYYIQLEKAVDDQKQKIRDLFLNSIEALVHALEAKDQYTAGHSRRVTKYALTIGKNMALTADYLDDLHWGALLHDVGKISIDPAIQNKPGRLTSDEYRYMMTHAMIGAGIVKPLASPEMIDIIVHHHDYYDGSGDGHGLKGGLMKIPTLKYQLRFQSSWLILKITGLKGWTR